MMPPGSNGARTIWGFDSARHLLGETLLLLVWAAPGDAGRFKLDSLSLLVCSAFLTSPDTRALPPEMFAHDPYRKLRVWGQGRNSATSVLELLSSVRSRSDLALRPGSSPTESRIAARCSFFVTQFLSDR